MDREREEGREAKERESGTWGDKKRGKEREV